MCVQTCTYTGINVYTYTHTHTHQIYVHTHTHKHTFLTHGFTSTVQDRAKIYSVNHCK